MSEQMMIPVSSIYGWLGRYQSVIFAPYAMRDLLNILNDAALEAELVACQQQLKETQCPIGVTPEICSAGTCMNCLRRKLKSANMTKLRAHAIDRAAKVKELEVLLAKAIENSAYWQRRAEKLEAELDALKHDIKRYVTINSELIAERDAACRKELDRIAKWLNSYDDDGGAGEAWGRRFAYQLEQKASESET